MGRSFSYAAYRALSRRKPLSVAPELPPRPAGELVWLHAADALRMDALRDLSSRLKQLRPEVVTLMTLTDPRAAQRAGAPVDGVDVFWGLEDDHPDAARRFLEHWQPDLCLWAGGKLSFNLIVATSEAGVPSLLLDIDASELKEGAVGWLRGPQRRALACFDAVLAADTETKGLLRKLGVSASRIEVSGPLRAGVMPPPCPDETVAETTKLLAGRPVWLAAHLPAAEASTILEAHRYAVRLSHRLLLVVQPDCPESHAEIAAVARTSGLRVASGNSGDPVDENIQVLIASDPEELGLWYRVAPLTLLGGTFGDAAGAPNPMDAAALGSAVLYGPAADPGHAEAFARLTEAGAARMIRDADTLGQAVVHLIAPDRVAEMALAGWQVVTEGAALADHVLERVQDMLDMRRVAHARA